MPEACDRTQLFLVTPERLDRPALEAALSARGIAAVLIATGTTEAEREAAAAEFVPIIQRLGAAALVADFTRAAGRSKADGVHIASGTADLRAAMETFRPAKIVGAGGTYSRHAAMEAGELEPDYLLFGNPQGDTHPEPHPKALDLAEWWSELMEIPAVVMAGSSLQSLEAARETGAAFVGLHRAVWAHNGGPAEAVRIALEMLGGTVEKAA